MTKLVSLLFCLSVSFSCFAQQLILVCNVSTIIETLGVGKNEEARKITLTIDTNSGVIDGGLASSLIKLDNFYPKATEEKYSAIGMGRYNKSLDLIVPMASYELNRYSGIYKANINLIAYGKTQLQEETGQCSQTERKF